MIITIIAFITPIVGMVMSRDSLVANAGAENSRVVADQTSGENKTCPQCGRRYSGTVTTCEADGAVLVA